MDIKKARVQRLIELIERLGGAANVARNFDDINPSYISQLINEIRPFGEKSARNLEKKLKLDEYYFDGNIEYKHIEQQPLLFKQEIPPYQVTIIEGKEIKPNEIALLDMYVKLSPESKEMVDYVTNKLYSMEYPKDKIAAPFNKNIKNHGSKK